MVQNIVKTASAGKDILCISRRNTAGNEGWNLHGKVRRKGMILLALCLPLLLWGCGGKEKKEDGKLQIVTTTTMLYDLTAAVAGEQAQVQALMGPGVDPHLYQASAGDVERMQNADVVVYNGLHLEGKMGDVFAGLEAQQHRVICAEDGIPEEKLLHDENNPEIYDPHVWFDVTIWMDAARHVARQLGKIDPDNREVYRENLESYLAQLETLDAYIRSRTEQLPPSQRILVTAHDAFRYFGKAYGFEVRGLQGINTDGEAGTADVRILADYIVSSGIKAIFVESSVPPRNIEALQAAVKARGFEVKIGGELYSDSLGDADSGQDSYVSACRWNIDAIVDGLK